MKENPKNFQDSFKSQNRLTAEIALGEAPRLSEPRLIDQWVLWLEQRPDEGGRTTALIRPWGTSEVPPQELTPAPINLRSRVHGYGGGVLASDSDGDHLRLAWIDDCDGCLWTQSWEGLSCIDRQNESWIRSRQGAICLSCKSEYLLADGFIDPFRRKWIGVMEMDGSDYLVSFALNQKYQEPYIIHRPQDFIGYASLSKDGTKLAWIEWQKPSMPWDSSQLFWGQINDSGEIEEPTLLADSFLKKSGSASFFKPIWLPSGELLVSEDSSGWWNLMIIGPDIEPGVAPLWKRLWPMEAETAVAQWVYGISTTSLAAENIVTLRCEKGSWRINLLSLNGSIAEVKQPFNDLTYLCADNNRLVAIASNPLTESGLLELDLSNDSWSHTPVRERVLDEDQISVPEPFWFEGFGGDLTHAWYYPPNSWNGMPAPLLVKSHSGPTGMARSGLNLAIQFWTSRGWGVVDVNYGGSTGFGREYRERLKKGWGEVDVFDCTEAAKFLVDAGKADSKLLAIEGGSAGGFTTLACLCFTDIFRVGACRYPVSDLISMHEETHRFEAGYLEHLLGSLQIDRQRYLDRSPFRNAERINCPVIFFQGMKDQIVLPSQTERMADKLRQNNVPVEVKTFPDEGHGFHDIKVKIKVLEATEKFFKKHLGF